jgi:rhodanese-related sulfurtransferase
MKISGKILFLCLMLLAGNLLRAQDSDTLKYFSFPPSEFRQALNNDKNALLVDVREFFEYKKSRIRNAVNIPAAGNLGYASDTLDKSRPLFLYCTSGFRSKRVAKYFAEHGFPKVYSLDGGITAWKKEGYPVDRRRIRNK